MGLFCTVYTRPGHPTFGQTIADPPTQAFTFHDGVGLPGDGTMTIPDTYDRFDDIVAVDTVTPSNSVSSLVRVWDDTTGTPTLVMEWLPRSIVPVSAKNDHDVSVAGRGIKSILNYARVEAWDWDGSADWVSTVPDWTYGGRNILANPSFEENTIIPKTFVLTVTATSGTFTISDGVDTTSAIAFNASAATIEAALEADIASITDIVVTGTGTAPITRFMEMVVPPFGVVLTVDGSGLSGGDVEIVAPDDGGRFPDPWTRSQSLVTGAPSVEGNYIEWEVSDVHAFDGTYSLRIHPAPPGATFNRNGGAQQRVRVTPGQTYQMSVWIYPTSGTDEFRMTLVGIGEELIATTGQSGQTLTPNTWNNLTLSDVSIPDNVTEAIFRVQCTNEFGNPPSIFYVDAAELNEGLAATTIGQILEDLFADATVDHVGDGRIVWEDEANPGTPYLSLDFTDTVDSNGDAWADSDIRIKLPMRFTYFQVMDQFAQTYGYEWRIVPDDLNNGTWVWQVYNPGGMMTDYTAAASPAIQGGASDTRRQIQRFIPDGTNHMVEGLGLNTARATNTGLDTALGRIESSRIDRELPSLGSVATAAAQDAANTLADGVQYGYELTDPQSRPLVAYLLGDLLSIHDPPDVDDEARLADVTVVSAPESTTYQVTFVKEET